MSFANFAREISDEIHQMEGHLEIAEFEIAFGNFSPLRNFNLGRPPTRIRPQKKKKKEKRNLFIFFHHLFSTIQGSVCPNPRLLSSAPLSPHFFSSTPSSPRPFLRVHLWVLTSFECTFEPSTILLSAPSSPHFPFSFYLGRSSITMRPFLFLLGQVTHYNKTLSFFFLGRSPVTMRPFLKYIYIYIYIYMYMCVFVFHHRAGRLEQWDHLRVSSYFIIG